MSVLIINVVVFALVSALSTSLGATFMTWQFWVLLAAMFIIKVNNETQ